MGIDGVYTVSIVKERSVVSRAELGRSSFYDFDDEIGIRQLALVVLKRWKVIASIVVSVAVAVALVNTYVLTPSYENSAVVFFSNPDSVVDFSFDAFQALASSPAVMAQVVRETRVDMSVSQLATRFSFKSDDGMSLLTASIKVDDPNLALRLIEAWIAAIRAETHRFMQDRLADRKALAEANYLTQREALLRAEEALVQFDREHALRVMEIELQRDISLLAAEEQRLETLRGLAIPADEATVRVLLELLAEEEAVLNRGLLTETQRTGELQFTVINPSYVEIRQRLTALESTLAANRRLVEALEESLPLLRVRVDEAYSTLTDLKIQRERLQRDVEEARNLFQAARAERDHILTVERQLPHVSRIDVVSEPVFSDRPVAPRKMLNLVIGVMLALVISVFGVLIAEWWRGGRAEPSEHVLR